MILFIVLSRFTFSGKFLTRLKVAIVAEGHI